MSSLSHHIITYSCDWTSLNVKRSRLQHMQRRCSGSWRREVGAEMSMAVECQVLMMD